MFRLSLKPLTFTLTATAFLLLLSAVPASADAPLCIQECTCASSCATACTKIMIIGGEPQEVEITCGQFGKCITSQSCQGECKALACTTTLNGTSAHDTINGGSAHECINGKAGNDTIDGNAGDDTIHGDDGTDTIYGDSGNDCLYGDSGGDNLTGESGNDYADGGTGTDTCSAEATDNCP